MISDKIPAWKKHHLREIELLCHVYNSHIYWVLMKLKNVTRAHCSTSLKTYMINVTLISRTKKNPLTTNFQRKTHTKASLKQGCLDVKVQ